MYGQAIKKLEVPPKRSDNKSMIITAKVTGSGHCRGDKWDIDLLENIDIQKIEECWKNDCEGEENLNEIEAHILYGDGGFMDNGMECVMDRLEKILCGEVVVVEGEEFDIEIQLA